MNKIILYGQYLFILFMVLFVANLFSDSQSSYDFPHKTHVVDQELDCATCHDGVEASTNSRDNFVPEKAICLDCHDAEDVTDYEPANFVIEYGAKFSHEFHVTKGLECSDCHGAIVEKEVSFPHDLPVMDNCLDCHQQNLVFMECSSCHYEGQNLKPVSHNLDFAHNHGLLARSEVKATNANMNCTSCHQAQFCQDCHEGENIAANIHPLNFQFTHSFIAQSKATDCATCHTDRSFCIDCHRDNNVMPHNHTAGWLNRIPNDGGRHASEALNDLEACASCHENNAQTICQPCHN